MALEAVVFQQVHGVGSQQQEQKVNYCNTEEMLAKSGGFGFGATWGTSLFSPTEPPPVDVRSCRRRRRRDKIVKNRQEIEKQRMTHIAVERNRRRQMNDYLAEIRSMMPKSYAQRGDQASIIGGAINFVKELEHFLQSLEARKRMKKAPDNSNPFSSLFSDFFSFPQYSTGSNGTHLSYAVAQKGSSLSSSLPTSPSPAVGDVEVTMVDSHANVKIRSKKHPKQLFSMVSGIHSLGLILLHLNVTSVENMALYSFSVKVEENCQLTTVNEVAAAVYEMVDRFQEEATA
ncbi:Transcription factor bHLH94 [Hibiscus syriacus]|uniref:Transcription factor bHLH94 n=1 Tax=Hibiscus syriacus TaxID=106335 RepID=A0A6A2ZN15_HIBSY|nr:transcription factor bHLH94-like [Hibiscus syriacus]KAE8693248.1 Transcription factor bHLH94 [Hibiscus syriacus]